MGSASALKNPQADEFNAALQALAQVDFEAAAAALSRHTDLGGDRNRGEAADASWQISSPDIRPTTAPSHRCRAAIVRP